MSDPGDRKSAQGGASMLMNANCHLHVSLFLPHVSLTAGGAGQAGKTFTTTMSRNPLAVQAIPIFSTTRHSYTHLLQQRALLTYIVHISACLEAARDAAPLPLIPSQTLPFTYSDRKEHMQPFRGQNRARAVPEQGSENSAPLSG